MLAAKEMSTGVKVFHIHPILAHFWLMEKAQSTQRTTYTGPNVAHPTRAYSVKAATSCLALLSIQGPLDSESSLNGFLKSNVQTVP